MLNTNDLANDQAELENAKLILQLDQKIENLIKDLNFKNKLATKLK